MCVVIDSNCLTITFNENNSLYSEFEIVNRMIMNNKIKLIYGGSTYREELKRMPNYLKIIVELRKAGKAHLLETSEVDNKENEIETNPLCIGCNDIHIIAIVIVSGCRLVCSRDIGLHPYLRKRDLYPNRLSPPKIYQGISHRNLLFSRLCRTCTIRSNCSSYH